MLMATYTHTHAHQPYVDDGKVTKGHNRSKGVENPYKTKSEDVNEEYIEARIFSATNTGRHTHTHTHTHTFTPLWVSDP